MTKWRCDSGTRNKHSTFSSLSKLSLSNVHKCRGSRATPPGRHSLLCSMQWDCGSCAATPFWHLLEQTTTSSLRSSLAHLARAPAAGAAVLGAPHLFLSHRAEAIEPQNGTATANYQPNHILPGFLLMMMTAQGVVVVAVAFLLTANLTFSTLLYGHINADICHSECFPSSLCSPRSSLARLSCVARDSRSRRHLFVRVSDGRVHSWSAKYIILYNGECG